MDYVYVALAIFLLLAAVVPLSMVITSKFLRPVKRTNRTKTANYESAERPIGETKDITNDYLPYFPLFLAFEIIGVITIIWSFAFSNLTTSENFYIILVVIGSTALSVVATIMINRNQELW